MAISIKADDIKKLIPSDLALYFDKQTKGFQTKHLLQQLQDKEKQMLRTKFNINSSDPITELRQRLAKIKEMTPKLSQLNGAVMYRMILEFDRQIGKEIGKEEAIFQNFLQEELNNFIKEDGERFAINSAEDLILRIVRKSQGQVITIGQKTHSGQVSSLLSLRDVGITSEELSNIFLSKLAPVTQARIRLLINERKERISHSNKVSFQVTNNKAQISVPLDWYSYSGGQVASTLDLSDEEIEQINENFKNKFIEVFGDNIPKIRDILDYIFKKNKKVLFIGNSDTQIVGICGEIQALCYLSLLMGDSFSLGKGLGEVDWAAQTFKNGKQSHADIILGHYGIQVKNSTSTLKDELDFSFVKSNLETFLNNLYIQNIIDYELKNYVMNVYEAYYFNQPYIMKYNGKKKNKDYIGQAESGDNKKFEQTRNMIVKTHQGLNEVLDRLVGILMYIGVGNAQKNRPSNIMFFVSGEIFFASEILQHILDKIEQADFNVKVSYNSSYSIINLINENGQKVFHYPGIVAFVDQKIKNDIKIKSSYNFGSLFN